MDFKDDRHGTTVRKELFLGTPCPLCGATGWVWIGGVEEETAHKIRADFPHWGPEEGACEGCIDAYTPPRLI